MNHDCIKCNTELVVDENITQYSIDHSIYICRLCKREYAREWLHRTGRRRPMNENKKCASFLGVYVAERVLAHVFKNVERMLYGNPGYDFICGSGYKIDVKSACREVSKKRNDRWTFVINKNQIAEYFLCLAFDNRKDLNPEHIWLIPAVDVNNHGRITISETTLARWDQYKLDVEKVSACCNILKST